jgi:hypothetical protein
VAKPKPDRKQRRDDRGQDNNGNGEQQR